MNKKILIDVVVVIVLGIIGWYVAKGANRQGDDYQNNTGSMAHTPVTLSNFTLADVAKHNSPASCYTIIDGKVYDMTAYINAHPGGPEMIQAICGKDGSAAYGGQHSGDRRAASALSNLQIGTLTQ